MAWTLDSDRPIFLQIVERIQTDIVSGRYQPGDKLPTQSEHPAGSAAFPSQRKHPSTRTPCKRPLQNLNAPVWSIPGGPADVLSRRIVI